MSAPAVQHKTWVRAVAIALMFALASCSGHLESTSRSSLPTVSLDETSAVLGGISVPQNQPALLQAAEAQAGTSISVVRVFLRWNTAFPDADHQALLTSGHRLHVSLRPRTDAGEVILWSDMASAPEGSELYDAMQSWADKIISMGGGNYFTLNHEPETTDSAANGDASDYVAAWQRFASILRARGGTDISLVWTLTGGAFRDERANLWYPGDEWVDIVGADPYNWYTCQGTDRAWASFYDITQPVIAFATAHGKRAALPEFASVEDPQQPGRKAQWMDEAAAVLQTESYQNTMEYVAWFNSGAGQAYPNCFWEYDTSAESAEAFARLMQSLG